MTNCKDQPLTVTIQIPKQCHSNSTYSVLLSFDSGRQQSHSSSQSRKQKPRNFHSKLLLENFRPKLTKIKSRKKNLELKIFKEKRLKLVSNLFRQTLLPSLGQNAFLLKQSRGWPKVELKKSFWLGPLQLGSSGFLHDLAKIDNQPLRNCAVLY